MFVDLFGGLDWGSPRSGRERAGDPGFILVAGSPPVGFAHVLDLGGHLHLEQLAVRPDSGRRGIGTALIEAVCREVAERGHHEITLMTYADVSWNAPFYERRGFKVLDQLPPFLEPLAEAERRLGLDRHGRRVVMRRAV